MKFVYLLIFLHGTAVPTHPLAIIDKTANKTTIEAPTVMQTRACTSMDERIFDTYDDCAAAKDKTKSPWSHYGKDVMWDEGRCIGIDDKTVVKLYSHFHAPFVARK